MCTQIIEFINRCNGLDNEAIYNLFEFEISEELRDTIMSHCDNADESEPVRCAMYNLGVLYNSNTLKNY